MSNKFKKNILVNYVANAFNCKKIETKSIFHIKNKTLVLLLYFFAIFVASFNFRLFNFLLMLFLSHLSFVFLDIFGMLYNDKHMHNIFIFIFIKRDGSNIR